MSVDWRKFFEDLPTSEHELAIVALANGDEVSIQRIMKYMDAFMVVRGRLGGTEDAGHVFCLPYDRIEFVFFSRIQPDQTVVEMFGDIIGGVRLAFMIDPEEEARKKALTEAAAAAAAAEGSEGAAPGTDGALPAAPKPAPANVSALRSRLLQNRSRRIDPRTRQN
jgi:hypothetical protein